MRFLISIYSILILLISQSLVVGQSSTGIVFQYKTYQSLLDQSKSENKLIFLDLSASWCGPCKLMEKQVFTDDSVAEFYNKNFICAKYDMEKGEGKMIAEKYAVTSVPTFIFISHSEEVAHKHVGSLTKSTFIELGKSALDPTNRLDFYKKHYLSDKTNIESVSNYVNVLTKNRLDTKPIVIDFLDRTSKNNLLQPEYINLIINNLSKDSTAYFTFILQNRDSIKQYYSSKEVDYFIFSVYYQEALKTLKGKTLNNKKYTYYHSKLSTFSSDSFLLKRVILLDIKYYSIIKDDKNYIKQTLKYFNTYSVNSIELMTAANYFSTKFDKQPAQLNQAEQWAKQAVQMQTTKSNTYIYAKILYKQQKYIEASDYITKSLSIAKEGENNDYIKKLQKKINRKLK